MSRFLKIKQRWITLSFRHQLIAVFFLLLVSTLFLTSGVFYFTTRAVLLERGFSLLQVSQKRALDKVYEFLESNPTLDFAKVSHEFKDRTGLGESGEMYVMDLDGRLLTESRFLKSPKPAPVPEDVGRHWMNIKDDYRGIPVLAVWDQISDGKRKIFLASEIDVAEVLGPLDRLFRWMVFFIAGIVGLVIIFIPRLARLLSQNFERQQELNVARKFALLEGQEQERQRLSMDLHDDIGPRLAALSWHLAAGTPVPHNIEDIHADIDELSHRIRGLSADLSMNILLHHGFQNACEALFDRTRREARLRGITFEGTAKIDPTFGRTLDLRSATMIYRVMQEACQNMLAHSKAKNGSCHLEIEADGRAHLVVKDDGQGFQPLAQLPSSETARKKTGGMGLLNIKTRVEILGGEIEIRSELGEGCEIEVQIPNMKVDHENLDRR